MNTITIDLPPSIEELAALVNKADEPYLVFDDREEPRFVIMSPAVLERLLFDSDLLNRWEHGSVEL